MPSCEYLIWPTPARLEFCGAPAKVRIVQRGLPVLDFLRGHAEFEFCEKHAELAKKRGGEVLNAEA